MLWSRTLWLVPAALTLVSFASSTAPAQAQTTYPFSATYNITATAKDLTPNIEEIFLSGTSIDAPYGLTEINSLSYSQTDFATGSFKYSADPTTFGLQGFPSGYTVFSGTGSNKLFALGSDSTGLIDFNTSTVTFTSSGSTTIVGGEGEFESATGTLSASQSVPASIQIGVALTGEYTVNGTIQTVPEPRTDIMPLGMGAIVGAGVLLRRRRLRSISD